MSREFQDRAFQRLSETNENLFGFLHIISPDLVKTLDPDSIEKLDCVIVSVGEEKVTEDRLFRVKSKGPDEARYGFLVLMAHQSSREKELYLRLLKAYVLLLERELREETADSDHHFWPIVIHTGEKKWNILTQRERQAKILRKREVSEDEIERILAKTPDFEIEYLDLAAADLDELKNLVSHGSEVGCLLGFMGARRDLDRSNEILEDILRKVRDNEVSGRVSHLLASIELLAKHSQPAEIVKDFSKKIRQSLNKEEEADVAAKVKTWAEEIEERVRLEGIEQGLEQGLREGELKSLRESIMDFVVERFPEASAEEVIGKLHAIDSLDQLKFIMKRALKWKNYEDVWTLPGDSNH